MKIICIDNKYNNAYRSITIGKEYNSIEHRYVGSPDYVRGLQLTCFIIIDDRHNEVIYPKKCFLTEKEIRKQKLERINENG